MKLAFFAVVWLVSLVRFSAAQCTLDVTLNGTSNSLRTTLLAEVIGGEFNDNKFDGEEALTYLCYTRDATDNSTFTGVRISAIYRYESSRRALRATLYCRATAWSYNTMTNSASEIPLSDHVSTNTTVEGCRDCLDASTESFNDPSWCNLTSPCDAMPAPCNTGTCSRTGLTELMCTCPTDYTGSLCETGNPCTTGANPCMNGGLCSTPSDFGSFNCDCSQTVWSGSTCNECSLQCQNGGTRDEDKCSCSCASGYSGTECGMITDVGTSTPAPGLNAGGIAGIIVAAVILLLIIITVIIVILVVLVRRKNKK